MAISPTTRSLDDIIAARAQPAELTGDERLVMSHDNGPIFRVKLADLLALFPDLNPSGPAVSALQEQVAALTEQVASLADTTTDPFTGGTAPQLNFAIGDGFSFDLRSLVSGGIAPYTFGPVTPLVEGISISGNNLIGASTLPSGNVTLSIGAKDSTGKSATVSVPYSITSENGFMTATPEAVISVDDAGADYIDFTIVSPAEYASGPHRITKAALAAGPVNAVPPLVLGTPAAGNVITARRGFAFYDDTFGSVVVSGQWKHGNSLIANTTKSLLVDNTHTTTLSYEETYTQGTGPSEKITKKISNVVQVERVDSALNTTGVLMTLENYVGESGLTWTRSWGYHPNNAGEGYLHVMNTSSGSYGNFSVNGSGQQSIYYRGAANAGPRQYAVVDYVRRVSQDDPKSQEQRTMGAAVRVQGAECYWLAYNGRTADAGVADDTWYLYYRNGTAQTVLASFANEFAPFDTANNRARMRLIADGNKLTVKYGIDELAVITDTRLSNGGVGLSGRNYAGHNTGTQLDNFAGGPF